MSAWRRLQFIAIVSIFAVSLWPSEIRAQNQVLGEIQFSGSSKVEKDSGVWIDGQYVGYLKELKGNKKITLLPGNHQVIARQTGYRDFSETIVIEPGQRRTVAVKLQKDATVRYPGADAATLKLKVNPERAAVFVDDNYAGHVRDFGGSFHSMLVAPGRHRIKIDLPGYRTFETEVNVLAGQKEEIKTELVKGSIEQAGTLIKEP
jgi:hypothetical protein